MESELRLQQSALQLNMRPCGGDTPQGENHKRREGYASNRDSRRLLYLHFPDVVPLQALDHLLHLVLHAGLMCLSHLCSHPQSLLKSVERTGPGDRGWNLCASPEMCGFTLLTLRSPPFKHGPRRVLHHFRFTSVISRRKK